MPRHHPLARDVDPMTVTYGTLEPGDVLESVWKVVAVHTLPNGRVTAIGGRPGAKRVPFTGDPDKPVQVHRKTR